jgi:predicted PurR-regulated permease PerM
MDFRGHLNTTGGALKNWFIAQSYDALAVGILWLVGLLILGIPFAPLWAFLGGALQFIPNIGTVLGVVGPAAAGLFSSKPERALYVLILYAVIVLIDGFILQPYLLKRTAKVPIWASILMPIVLGIIFPFWGILLAAPLLAVLYAYRARNERILAARQTEVAQVTDNRG